MWLIQGLKRRWSAVATNARDKRLFKRLKKVLAAEFDVTNAPRLKQESAAVVQFQASALAWEC